MIDIYVIESDSLMVARPKGTLDAQMAERIVEFIEIKEQHSETGFHRFCDLSSLEGIRLSDAEVQSLADRRSAFNPNDIRVKSAFLAIHPLAYGIARMYEQMLHSPRIEVRVFSQLEPAAEWLAIKPGLLTL
ncbi:MAG TPA: hypothetical protein VMG82_11330 [Candidatus Sulfotelmatobacter sp.]|nr:hypothetical protein [Candidatus Sulfotelmatobacter sp.]